MGGISTSFPFITSFRQSNRNSKGSERFRYSGERRGSVFQPENFTSGPKWPLKTLFLGANFLGIGPIDNNW